MGGGAGDFPPVTGTCRGRMQVTSLLSLGQLGMGGDAGYFPAVTGACRVRIRCR